MIEAVDEIVLPRSQPANPAYQIEWAKAALAFSCRQGIECFDHFDSIHQMRSGGCPRACSGKQGYLVAGSNQMAP